MESNKEIYEKNSGKDNNPWGVSQYARVFDDTCIGWTKSSEKNLLYLRHQCHYCNDLLKAKGRLYLNEVYDVLGIPRTEAGHAVGWIYNEEEPTGDNYVDFGIYTERGRHFVNGYENSILLDFNVDGVIIDKL